MMQPQKKRVIYYSDLTDDFAGTHIRTQKVDGTFRFIHNGPIFKVASFLLYYLIAIPLGWIYIKVVNGTKIINRKAVRQIKGGFFLYGNHTHWSDAYLPHIVAAPKRTYVIASPDAVSIKGLKNIVLMLGAIPIPTEMRTLPNFTDAVKKRCGKGGCVAVYPEAHIWPYYPGIRHFPDTSFRYPAELGVPTVAMAITFRKRKGLLRFIKAPARTVILSDPIYAEPGMSAREARGYLCKRVYDFMKDCAERTSNYEYIRYEQI